jgi:hypothetical protein
MAELRWHIERHPPFYDGDYAAIKEFEKEIRAFERAQKRAEKKRTEKKTRRKKTVTLVYPDKKRVKVTLPVINRSIQQTRDGRKSWRLSLAAKSLLENAFPCLECDGDGWIYDPKDQPCPVEGNKMRDRLTCPKCKGTRTCPREEFRAYHLEVQKLQKGKYDQAVDGLAKLQKALNKLSPADYQAIRQDGNR